VFELNKNAVKVA